MTSSRCPLPRIRNTSPQAPVLHGPRTCLPARLGAVALVLPASCMLRGGSVDFADRSAQALDNLVWEAEASTPRWGRFDATLGVGLVSGPSTGSLSTTAGSVSAASVDLFDVRAATRLHLLGPAPPEGVHVDPYVGAGGGFFRLRSTTRGAGREVACPPGFPGTCYELVEENATLADGFYPFVSVGAQLRLGRCRAKSDLVWALGVEVRQEFAKSDGPYDFDNVQVLFGVGVSW